MKTTNLFSVIASLLMLVPLTFAGIDSTQPTTHPSDGGTPVTIPNALQYGLTSKVNGQDYRLMVYLPPKLDVTKPAAVVYVLDGSYYFGAACDAAAINQLDGIVVGIGYPTDDRTEINRRRTFDLSLPTASGNKKYGGGDAFLRVVDEEIKPFINSHYKIDPANQALFGHSLGGLMTLRELFRNPDAFSTYLITSPSIWWNTRSVLEDEAAFSKRAKAGELHLRVLITSATDEQYHGTDEKLLAGAQKVRMVDNASELAARLTALDPANLVVTRELIVDETHTSGSIASLTRALRFELHPVK